MARNAFEQSHIRAHLCIKAPAADLNGQFGEV
jgi:hypothetical protein